MARIRYNEHLKAVPLFAGLDDDELETVSRAATELDYDAGKVLIEEGTVAHEMYVVTAGTLEVTRDGEHVAEIGPGGFAGEMSLLTRSGRTATVSAKTDVSIIHIDGRSFNSILKDVPSIAVKMLPVVAERAADNAQDGDD